MARATIVLAEPVFKWICGLSAVFLRTFSISLEVDVFHSECVRAFACFRSVSCPLIDVPILDASAFAVILIGVLYLADPLAFDSGSLETARLSWWSSESAVYCCTVRTVVTVRIALTRRDSEVGQYSEFVVVITESERRAEWTDDCVSEFTFRVGGDRVRPELNSV